MSTLTMGRGWGLATLADMAGGALRPAAGADVEAIAVTGVSIDTRTLRAGDLFVPLPGETRDGHEFLDQAFARGAAAALCARERYPDYAGREPGPLVIVTDVTEALQRCAREHRRGWNGTMLAITGSNGKTTTKELTAAVFATAYPTLKTEGNLNNQWGLPMTLLGIEPRHQAAVVELGMNRPGEIVMLAGIAEPNAGIITNVGTAHIERFGSVAALAREKASLGFALAAGCPLIASADSPALLAALEGAPCRLVTFGWSEGAEVRPDRIEDLGPNGTQIEVTGFPRFRLPLVGRHQVSNALAALAVARVFELDPEESARALEHGAALPGRMEVRHARGATLLVDCYNANPDSTRAALDTLAAWPGASRRIAVLGDMLELGDQSAVLHRDVGEAVHGAEAWVAGTYAADYAAGAREAGIEARVFENLADVRRALFEAVAPGVVVLLKASRGVALERVLEGLETEPS